MKTTLIVILTGCALAGAFALTIHSLRNPQIDSERPAVCDGTPTVPDAAHARATGCHLYCGIDTSGSWRQKGLGQSVVMVARLAAHLDPNHDWVTLFRVDKETREFYDQSAPDSSEAIQHTIVAEVKDSPEEPATLPATFWTEVAGRAMHDPRQVIVFFFTDGDNDDTSDSSIQKIRESARQLAANSKSVAVCVMGASNKNWAALRECFSVLGDRFHLHTASGMDLETALSLIDEVRARR